MTAEPVHLLQNALSGDCYAVRLFCGLADIAWQAETVEMPVPAPAHCAQGMEAWAAGEAMRLAPVLRAPVLRAPMVQGAIAIMTELVRIRRLEAAWLPAQEIERGDCERWLDLARDSLSAIERTRLLRRFSGQADPALPEQGAARRALRELDDCLAERSALGSPWLCADTPSVADVATFAYAALAGDAGIDCGDLHALAAWSRRIQALPGFVAFPGNLI